MKVDRVSGEDVVSWVIDFIYMDLNALDGTERWKLAADAHKFLRLWDTSTNGGEIYPSPPFLNLSKLQNELRAVFESHLLPLLGGEGVNRLTTVPEPDFLVPRVLFVDDEGYLYSTRLLDGDIEKVGIANFIDAIHSITTLPVNSFRRCEGCGRWFFPIGKRIRKDRRFCSRPCNLRETARRQRERMKKEKITKSQSKEKK